MRRKYHCRSLHRRRRGYALVIFALIFFCLMALGALVIDLGLARMTQRQMQTAVDSAALEGLRGRDVDPADSTNLTGRSAALQIIRQTFDDDLDLDQDERYFGAGPLYHLGPSTGTDPALAAGQLLTIDPARVYKPFPVANAENAEHGDLVAGNYTRPNDAATIEQRDYARNDFAAAQGGDAFLARLRRSNDFQGLDNVDGVSHAGFALPFLFGRGSLIHKDNDRPNPNEYSPREHGITVRATAIAQASRTKSVGRRPDLVNGNIAGVLPFSFIFDVAVVHSTAAQTLTISSSDLTSDLAGAPNPAGFITDTDFSDGIASLTVLGQSLQQASGSITAGQVFAAGANLTDPAGTQAGGYAPVVVPLSPGGGISEYFVVGFVYVVIDSPSDPAGSSISVQIRANRIASENASNTWTAPMSPALAADADALSSVLNHHRALYPHDDPLLVPPSPPIPFGVLSPASVR